MATRTTSAAVKGILLSDYGETAAGVDPSLTPFIETAAAIVDDVVECALAKDLTLSVPRKELIERWLAAHFYVMSDQVVKEERTEGAHAKYQGETNMYLEASKYGQQAILLDSTGCLAAIAAGGENTADGFWLGKPESEQIPLDERD